MEKQTSRSLSLAYQKKDWRAGPHQSFFWYDTDYKTFCEDYRLQIHSWCHTKRRIGPKRRIGLSFFWYDNDMDLKVCISMTHLISVWHGRWQRLAAANNEVTSLSTWVWSLTLAPPEAVKEVCSIYCRSSSFCHNQSFRQLYIFPDLKNEVGMDSIGFGHTDRTHFYCSLVCYRVST